jgi:hypothetical protein
LHLTPIDPPKVILFCFYFQKLTAYKTSREIIWLKQGFEILEEIVEDIRKEGICPYILGWKIES